MAVASTEAVWAGGTATTARSTVPSGASSVPAPSAAAEGAGGAEVDVADLRLGEIRLDVGHYPDHPGHGPRDVELLGADQRYVDDAEAPGGGRREIAVQVGGGGEPDTDQVVGDELVALQDRGEQLAHPLVHVSGLVPLELDGSTDCSYRHVVPLVASCCVPFQPRGAAAPPVTVLCP